MAKTVRLLGVTVDANLNLKHHISQKAKAASFALYKLKKIRRYLDKATSLKLANSLIFSHMDYCNSLFVNLPSSYLQPLQRVQSLTAKVILKKSKFHSSTECLRSLHILPVQARAKYKILLLVYKCLNNLAPSYLSDLLHVKTSSYATRSSAALNLNVPFTQKNFFADRSFSIAGPTLWNDLPINVRNTATLPMFKKALKTHLFTQYFS